MIDEQVYYSHGETTDGYRFTIAGRYQTLIENDIDKDCPDVIMLGVSLCSRTENFAKKLGRVRAEGRMKSKTILGRTYFSLYKETRPLNWFDEHRTKTFLDAARLNGALTRTGLMRKFNL